MTSREQSTLQAQLPDQARDNLSNPVIKNAMTEFQEELGSDSLFAQTATSNTTDDIRCACNKKITSSNLTQQKAAAQIGVTQPILNQWLNKKYKGKIDMSRKIEAWLNKIDTK